MFIFVFVCIILFFFVFVKSFPRFFLKSEPFLKKHLIALKNKHSVKKIIFTLQEMDEKNSTTVITNKKLVRSVPFFARFKQQKTATI